MSRRRELTHARPHFAHFEYSLLLAFVCEGLRLGTRGESQDEVLRGASRESQAESELGEGALEEVTQSTERR